MKEYTKEDQLQEIEEALAVAKLRYDRTHPDRISLSKISEITGYHGDQSMYHKVLRNKATSQHALTSILDFIQKYSPDTLLLYKDNTFIKDYQNQIETKTQLEV